LPLAEERNEEVAFEFAMQNLTEEVEVRDEGCLEDDRNV